jgi:hypothetical protein
MSNEPTEAELAAANTVWHAGEGHRDDNILQRWVGFFCYRTHGKGNLLRAIDEFEQAMYKVHKRRFVVVVDEFRTPIPRHSYTKPTPKSNEKDVAKWTIADRIFVTLKQLQEINDLTKKTGGKS